MSNRTLAALAAGVAVAGIAWFVTRSPEPAADTPPAVAPGAPPSAPEARPDAPRDARPAPRVEPVAPDAVGRAAFAGQPAPTPSTTQPPSAAPQRDPAEPPEHFRRAQAALEEWVLTPVNRHANARVLGTDCQLSICTLAMLYDGVSDSHFFTRAEEWFAAQPGPGRPLAYPHRRDAYTFQVWYFWSPYEEGTAEDHQFVERVTSRIRAEIGDPPDDPYYYLP